MSKTQDKMKLVDFSYTIDRKFDKVGVFTTFEKLPTDDFGYTIWPKDMEPDMVGTSVDFRKHMQAVRKEQRRRAEAGERIAYYIAIWIDGIWLVENTAALTYYIEEASYSGKKPYVLEGTRWAEVD